MQQRHADRQLETPWPGAARIDEQHAVAPLFQGFVRMAGDHHVGARWQWPRNVGCFMSDVQADLAAAHALLGRHAGPLRRGVVVAAHHRQRRQGPQRVEDFRLADIARVNQLLAATQGLQGRGAQQAVGVGDQTDFHGGVPGGEGAKA
jgi:hypothetical protein